VAPIKPDAIATLDLYVRALYHCSRPIFGDARYPVTAGGGGLTAGATTFTCAVASPTGGGVSMMLPGTSGVVVPGGTVTGGGTFGGWTGVSSPVCPRCPARRGRSR
jgi:hypothetical protein